MRSFTTVAFTLAAALLACSSSDDAASGASPQAQQQATTRFCAANRPAQCADAVNEKEDYDQCLRAEGVCAAALFSPAGIDAFAKCMEARSCKKDGSNQCSCDKSDDVCFAEAAKTVPASPKRDAYEGACRRKLDECGKGTPTSFSDDWCTPGDIGWQLFADGSYDALAPCFDGACGTVTQCLTSALKRLSPTCAD